MNDQFKVYFQNHRKESRLNDDLNSKLKIMPSPSLEIGGKNIKAKYKIFENTHNMHRSNQTACSSKRNQIGSSSFSVLGI